jgi:excisionase family DNA binding protein
MSATEERLLSLEDVANRLQVSDQSVRRWIKAGKLAAYKPGLEWRIRPSDLENFLQAHSYPKVQAPLPESSEERRAEWDAAVRSARELRESGQARAEELLALWRESKDRKEDPAKRRAYLDEMGELLQDAYDARPTLLQAMSYQRFADQWPELQKADRFYVELWHLVQGRGLNIRTGNAQEERPQAVEESEAA